MDLRKNLGENIQKYRKLNHITQEKLAEMIDIEINSISSIERGKYFPSPENLTKIAAALNVSLPDLFNFQTSYTKEDYEKEILNNIKLLRNDKTKLCAINTFIKNLLFM